MTTTTLDPQETEKKITVYVNGYRHEKTVEPSTHLIDFLRDHIGLRTCRTGCEHGVCGACTVRMNGEIVRGCLILAVHADGNDIETIDAASERGDLKDLQTAFHSHNALQCGFCTPGMLFTAAALINEKPLATRDEIREYIGGNYCRCTGYQAIVDAIQVVLVERQKKHRLGNENNRD